MRRETDSQTFWLHTSWSFVTKFGAISMLFGGIIGTALGNVGVGLAIGFFTGALAGLVVGLRTEDSSSAISRPSRSATGRLAALG